MTAIPNGLRALVPGSYVVPRDLVLGQGYCTSIAPLTGMAVLGGWAMCFWLLGYAMVRCRRTRNG